jgi:putative ABC transport system substrate-binding protein
MQINLLERRELISLLGGFAIAWPVMTHAQQRSVPRIGVLSPLSPSEQTSVPFESFRNALRKFGYVEGQNIHFVYRWASGSHERLEAFAAELVGLKVDVIFSAPGTPTAIAAQKATRSIPIVFAGVGDAVGTKLVATLAKPGGNATGLVNQSQDIAGKQLQFLKEGVPSISNVGVLWRPSNPSYRNLLNRFEDVVRATNVKVTLIGVENRAEIEGAFEKMQSDGINGLLVQADDLFISEGARIIELAAAYRLPAIYRIGYQAGAGGLMAYGPDIPDMYRRAGLYVHKVLQGISPGELPVEQPTKIELVVNLRTAKLLGLSIPLPLQVAADEVVE